MNKRILAALLALGVLATSNAFASRARDLVMGSGDAGNAIQNGSLYYDTAYNIFYNPSYVNDFKNWATIEKSNSPGTTAEGGFVIGAMNLNLGVYLNRTSGITGVTNEALTHTGVANYRPIDLIAGGEMGNMKWGFGLTYGSVDAPGATPPANGRDLTLRAGLQVMELDPYISYKVLGGDNAGGGAAATTSFKDINVGTRYHYGEWVPYADYHHMSDNTDGSSANPSENAWGFGLGRNVKVADGVSMNYAISYWRDSLNNNTGAAGNYVENTIPINLSLEGDATGWLTLRAGLQYRLYDKKTGTGTVADATNGRIGATVHVKKVDFDWAVGTDNGGAEAAAETATQTDKQAFSIGGGFFTAAALNYHW